MSESQNYDSKQPMSLPWLVELQLSISFNDSITNQWLNPKVLQSFHKILDWNRKTIQITLSSHFNITRKNRKYKVIFMQTILVVSCKWCNYNVH